MSESDVNISSMIHTRRENEIIHEISKILVKISVVQGTESDHEQLENKKKKLYSLLKYRLDKPI